MNSASQPLKMLNLSAFDGTLTIASWLLVWATEHVLSTLTKLQHQLLLWIAEMEVI